MKNMNNSSIDNGRSFDWGNASENYAKYRDIYPKEMYGTLYRLGFGGNGTKNLDIGTGTGVVPRFMRSFGGDFFGIDISENQVKKAKELSDGFGIDYRVGTAEDIPFENGFFDSACAVQCWRYFDKQKASSEIRRVLKNNGVFIIAYMQWLPSVSEITAKSLALVKRFNPDWDCFGDRIDVKNSKLTLDGFRKKEFIDFYCDIPFSRESWNGRMVACRGIEPSLSAEEVKRFSAEHLKMLEEYNERFTLRHQIVFFCFEKI